MEDRSPNTTNRMAAHELVRAQLWAKATSECANREKTKDRNEKAPAAFMTGGVLQLAILCRPLRSHRSAITCLTGTPEVVESEAGTGLVVSDHYPEVGTRVGYAGFPLGMQLLNASPDPTYAVGVVGTQTRQSGKRKNIQISGPVVGGYSGSPIVREDKPDEVIGIVSDSPSKEAGQAGIFMASSWEHLGALARLAC